MNQVRQDIKAKVIEDGNVYCDCGQYRALYWWPIRRKMSTLWSSWVWYWHLWKMWVLPLFRVQFWPLVFWVKTGLPLP